MCGPERSIARARGNAGIEMEMQYVCGNVEGGEGCREGRGVLPVQWEGKCIEQAGNRRNTSCLKRLVRLMVVQSKMPVRYLSGEVLIY